MKYERGSFITVPSREVLSGLHPTAQSLYMWLCAYANETGTCYPARKTLAKNVGCSETMIDKMVDLLIEHELLKIKGRKDGDRQLSNLYTVLIQPPLPQSGTPPTTEYEGVYHDVRTNSIQLTQSSEGGEQARIVILKDSDSPEKPEAVIPSPYSIEGTHGAWEFGERRLQVLDWYLTHAGLWRKAATKPKLKSIMARHNNAAVRIANAGWTLSELNTARKKIQEIEFLQGEWTLETVEKYLTK